MFVPRSGSAHTSALGYGDSAGWLKGEIPAIDLIKQSMYLFVGVKLNGRAAFQPRLSFLKMLYNFEKTNDVQFPPKPNEFESTWLTVISSL